MKLRKITTILLCAFSILLSGSCGAYIYAASMEELTQQKKDAQAQQEKLKEEQEAAEKEAAKQREARKKLQEELGDMNSELQTISNKVADLEEEIADTEDQIARTGEALAAAQEVADEQFEDMKLRIRYMYENSSTSTLAMILESKDFAEFLNRINYVAELTSYDRDKLTAYEDTMRQIAEDQKQLEEERGKLGERQEELAVEQKQLLASIDKKESEIDSVQSAEADSIRKAEALQDKISKMEDYEKELERKKAELAAEEQRKAASDNAGSGGGQSSGNDGSGSGESPGSGDSGNYSGSEFTLLAALIYCEAGGESYEGQLAVGTVVMNRIASPRFPNTMAGVIYQSGQFTPAASGKLALALENNLATESCKKAARAVLSGTRTGSWLFFCMNYGNISGTVIDHQVFY